VPDVLCRASELKVGQRAARRDRHDERTFEVAAHAERGDGTVWLRGEYIGEPAGFAMVVGPDEVFVRRDIDSDHLVFMLEAEHLPNGYWRGKVWVDGVDEVFEGESFHDLGEVRTWAAGLMHTVPTTEERGSDKNCET
jgi:hypothetical protein